MNRIGEIGVNNQGTTMKIIAYRGRLDMDVMFNNGYIKHSVTHSNFKNGSIKNPYVPSVYGVGYLGEGKHNATISQKPTRQYVVWSMMLQRCYMSWINPNNVSYNGCSVCNEWHNFQKFADWYDENYYTVSREEMNLDKDILVKGNKVYSPETCIFAPKNINILFIKSSAARGNLPIGVTLSRNSYMMQYHDENGKLINAAFKNSSEAFQAYKNGKERTIQKVAEKYKCDIPRKLYSAMMNYRVDLND
jgi:hypothetical protein